MKSHSQKGLSAIVASVLLVVAAIIIGTVLTVWASNQVNQRVVDSSTSDCIFGTSFSVPSLTYTTAYGVGYNNSLTGRFTNTGTKTLSNITAELEYLNGTILTVAPNSPASTANITAGQSAVINISVNVNDSLFKSVKIYPFSCPRYALVVKTILYKNFTG